MSANNNNNEESIPRLADEVIDGGRSIADGRVASKPFDTTETHFFEQGDDSTSIPVELETYDEPGREWLSRKSLVGVSLVSTTVAVLACVALYRSNARPSAVTLVTPPNRPVACAPAAQPVAAPTSIAEPASTVVAAEPVPAHPATPPVAEPVPAAAVVPAKPVVAAASPPVAPAPPAIPEKTAVPALPEKPVAPPALPEKPTAQALAAPDTPAPQPVVAVAAPPAGEQDQARCKQALSARRAKDILAACPSALAADPGAVDVALALAKIEFDRGRFAQAQAFSSKAIATNPDAADAYVFIGGAEQNAGHRKAAKEAYQHYLRLAPSGRYATDLRQIVGTL